ncbi:hypothetical protein KASHIRA_01150 [Serratia phage vB_SmaM-Kashira]|nr:hypothetical protein [Acinetobacter phage ABPH49]URC22689.1 hypothetical protein KASHIRA_01150 [Serratia phage vB_SmaM-Kashira]
MESYHEMMWRWYLEGARCYSSGGKIEDCPYSPEDEESHREWMDGFADAQMGDL